MDEFSRPPHLLILEEKNIALLWSAKSGSTFAVKWFLAQNGKLDEALEYSSWIHDYRTKIYKLGENYKKRLELVRRGGFEFIKIVRNPYSRAVSSFLHHVKTPGAHGFHKPLSDYLGRMIDESPGVSFSEFVSFLKSIDLSECDVHYSRQIHSLEIEKTVKLERVIHLENLEFGIRKLESDFGLFHSDIKKMSQSHHRTIIDKTDQFVGNEMFCGRLGSLFPRFEKFYDSDLMETIYDLYKVDFIEYGYRKDCMAIT